MMDQDMDTWLGNRRRKLWKSTCMYAAQDVCLHHDVSHIVCSKLVPRQPHLSEVERVVYAALCPSLKTLSVLLRACRTWEDIVWAQVSALFEEKQNEAMERLCNGGFWEGGVSAVEKDTAEGADVSMDTEEDLDDSWKDEVEQTLSILADAPVQDGLVRDMIQSS